MNNQNQSFSQFLQTGGGIGNLIDWPIQNYGCNLIRWIIGEDKFSQ